MHLAELKQKSIADLNEVARDLKIDGAPTLRKQELIFAILQAQTANNGVVFGEGVLATGVPSPRHEVKYIGYYKPGSGVMISGVTREIIERYYAYKKRSGIAQKRTTILSRILEWFT